MKKIKALPPTQHLVVCLSYERSTGRLFWRARPRTHFATQRAYSTWNKRYAGTQAFTAINPQGYFFGSIDNEKYLAHRVIWKLVTKKEPPPIVDHKDRNSKNNRFVNLRAATKSQNNINSTKKAGIYFDVSRGNWQAYIKLGGRKIHLGRHPTKHKALQARKVGAQRLFGIFAP